MGYLIVDSSMPELYGKFGWCPRIENATPFSSSADANAEKHVMADATGVIEFNGRWYVIEESK